MMICILFSQAKIVVLWVSNLYFLFKLWQAFLLGRGVEIWLLHNNDKGEFELSYKALNLNCDKVELQLQQ